MSYFPYFRGKQYELICLRENAELIGRANFTPIIEPVRADTGGLERCIDALLEHDASLLVVANPGCGALVEAIPQKMIAAINTRIDRGGNIKWLYRYHSPQGVERWLSQNEDASVLHSSPTSSADLQKAEANTGREVAQHIFVEAKDSGALYRRSFADSTRILVRDGFRKKKNSDYLETPIEHFSDLHITYRDDRYQGFGDFLTVGDDYSDSGGPAYAVAIHISFVDPEKQNSMFLEHFVSDSNDTPADPAGKFSEALSKLARRVRQGGSNIANTAAIREFLALNDRAHYPGLGYVKKLSMQHHLELMSTLGEV